MVAYSAIGGSQCWVTKKDGPMKKYSIKSPMATPLIAKLLRSCSGSDNNRLGTSLAFYSGSNRSLPRKLRTKSEKGFLETSWLRSQKASKKS